MTWVFYISAAIAVTCTALVVTRRNAMHALIYLVLTFVSTAAVFASLGAPLLAALQIIVYAGAIMVLFVFVVMLLNMGARTTLRESMWLRGRELIPPAVIALLLLGLLSAGLSGQQTAPAASSVGPKAVGVSLFRVYVVGVEAASLLLLAALVGAFHFGLLRERSGEDAE